MPRWNDQDAGEGKHNLAIAMTNAVFSKLIKMGRELGKTPQRMAQELFEEAYAARCMGKAKLAGQVEIAGPIADLANAVEADLLDQLAEARRTIADQNRQLTERDTRLSEERNKLDALHTAIREAAYEAWPAAEDVGEDAGEIIRELAGERDKAEMDLLKAREEIQDLREAAKGQLIVVNQASEILRREAAEPQRVPCPPAAIDLDKANREKIDGLKRLIIARAACGLTRREIARELGLPMGAVRQVLG